MIAGKDPLRDDSFKVIVSRLHNIGIYFRKLGVDIHVKEFRTFPHGFLSFYKELNG